jgi:hypothetical protein
MGKKQHLIQLPLRLQQQLETMAHERDMDLNALVTELVHLGLRCLEYPAKEPAPAGTGLQGIDPSGVNYRPLR